jgi:chorismate mutase
MRSSIPPALHADPTQTLDALREELDSIDQRLLDILRERLDCCARIGLYKKRNAVPMMQPHRFGIAQARAEAFAIEHGISPEFLRSLYDRIIEETCRIEDDILASRVHGAAAI